LRLQPLQLVRLRLDVHRAITCMPRHPRIRESIDHPIETRARRRGSLAVASRPMVRGLGASDGDVTRCSGRAGPIDCAQIDPLSASRSTTMVRSTRSRREFLETIGGAGIAAAGTLATLESARGYAANDAIEVACLGTGGRCRTLMKSLAQVPGVRLAAVCDIY